MEYKDVNYNKRDKICALRELQFRYSGFYKILEDIIKDIDKEDMYPCQKKLLGTKQNGYSSTSKCFKCIITEKTYMIENPYFQFPSNERYIKLILETICNNCEYLTFSETKMT